ncbi:MAG: hypothetical protein KY476_17040 [Planctomycetes bacterium]|nr:hypothetical protein [Planctomycetota bacterium]
MFAFGDIVAFANGSPFVPNRPALVSALRQRWTTPEDELICYGLTPQGGHRWEQDATPDWDRFYDYTAFDEETEIVAGSAERLRELLDHASILFHVEILRRTVAEDVIDNWEATPWKVLSKGYRARFQSTPSTDGYWYSDAARGKRSVLDHWANSLSGRAHL